MLDLALRDESGSAVTSDGVRISDLRGKLSGWHFSKEMLTDGEREILDVAEQVMEELDRIAGGYYH